MWEKISTFVTWCIAVVMAWLGGMDLKDVSTVAGVLIGLLMALISWYYKHKTYQLLASGRITREEYESADHKRCAVGVVLALAATMPGFQQLHTSVEGLRLIADFEGCRLQPYQCSAGKWTDGIGNTSGVVPGKSVTERQAAGNFITNVLRTEAALARCVAVSMPQQVYDALVSLAFNVGTGNVCGSTMVALLKKGKWREACYQLPRWVYVKGVFNQGLDNRRGRELAWCLKGV